MLKIVIMMMMVMRETTNEHYQLTLTDCHPCWLTPLIAWKLSVCIGVSTNTKTQLNKPLRRKWREL